MGWASVTGTNSAWRELPTGGFTPPACRMPTLRASRRSADESAAVRVAGTLPPWIKLLASVPKHEKLLLLDRSMDFAPISMPAPGIANGLEAPLTPDSPLPYCRPQERLRPTPNSPRHGCPTVDGPPNVGVGFSTAPITPLPRARRLPAAGRQIGCARRDDRPRRMGPGSTAGFEADGTRSSRFAVDRWWR